MTLLPKLKKLLTGGRYFACVCLDFGERATFTPATSAGNKFIVYFSKGKCHIAQRLVVFAHPFRTRHIMLQPTAHSPAPTILLIDDSVMELRVLLDMLAARKWRTVVSFDGLDGYHKASLKQPDLILLDVRMPGMDGFGTLRRLKAEPRTQTIPVIFLTSAEDKADRLTGLSLGAVDYIIKPFVSEEEVLARIGIHLELSRRPGVTSGSNANCSDGYSSLLAAATTLLLEQMSNPPAMEVLVRQLGTNEKRLSDAFQEAFQLPVFGWLREQRLKLARQLLAQTDTPIADIAAHCGYGSPANFATAFKDRFECVPRDFRRRAAAQTEIAQ